MWALPLLSLLPNQANAGMFFPDSSLYLSKPLWGSPEVYSLKLVATARHPSSYVHCRFSCNFLFLYIHHKKSRWYLNFLQGQSKSLIQRTPATWTLSAEYNYLLLSKTSSYLFYFKSTKKNNFWELEVFLGAWKNNYMFLRKKRFVKGGIRKLPKVFTLT